jgi:hypothetical protein
MMPCAFKKSIWLMVISSWLILPLVIQNAIAQDESASGDLKFNYAFAALPETGESPRLVSIKSTLQLNSGDKLKLYLEALSEAYFYLFHLDPGGALAQLFPHTHQTARLNLDQKVTIPAGNQWLELDANTGMEKFYLIASPGRQDRLESLYEEYLSAGAGNTGHQSAGKVIDEINRIRRKNLSKSAERPVRIGGNFRGPKQNHPDAFLDIADLAATVTTNGAYSRSFTIDHR